MKIGNLLKKEHIFFDMEAGDKRELIGKLVEALKARGVIDRDKHILEALLKREGLGSTGLEKGIAIPHAIVDEVKEPLLALSVIKEGIDFEAADHLPTYVVLLLLGSKNNPGSQLKILAHVCRMVKETDVVEKLKTGRSAAEILAILEKEEGHIE
ncbi:MAG: PTS sugar transporter subunit IIA [Acidobacteria bacterium]|nr:PTS sugar transporter subunit IIA [Acidobacteriota bacterium]MBU4254511.1 PTS sugar transporter subunit IIA [Acidobacteriota bacterium]MBU4329189.1 PTS sugar transporter subunit IIA [Acidobacteriota bacterium]MBU4493891.1 PTS sugar transporter subunit IIA [Acidobacteriota bacterium]MCG2814565.1 PTS sugar transporter subunit IIA [Candidatus Aminicenantes bacterium]